MRRTTLGVCVLLGALASAAVAAGERPKVAVMDLRADTPLDRGTLATLNQVLLAAFHEAGAFDVIGSTDIRAMLALEEERIKLTGCADDACLAEIGGALGVQLMATARVGAVGEEYVVSVSLLEVEQARVLDRTSETVPRDDRELLAAVEDAVARVVATARRLLGVDGASSVPGWAPWLCLGATVALGAAGGVLGGLAWSAAGEIEDTYKGDPEVADLEDASRAKALGADVLFGLAGAAAVTTVVLFVLVAGDDGAPASAGVLPIRGGGVAAATLRFW